MHALMYHTHICNLDNICKHMYILSFMRPEI